MTFPFPAILSADTYNESLLQYYLQVLASPAGIMGASCLVALAVGVLIIDWLKWPIITALIPLLNMTISRPYIAELPQPFLGIAAVNRAIAIGLLMVLLVAAIQPSRSGSFRLPWVAVWLLLFQAVMCVKYLSMGQAAKGIGAFPIYLLSFLAIVLGTTRWLADPRQFPRILRAIGFAPIVFVAVDLALLVMSPTAAISNGRLYGISSNPQWLAAGAVLCIPFALGIATDSSQTIGARIVYWTSCALAILLVLGTGSRMGALAAVVGVMGFFRHRLGPLLLTTLIVSALAFGVYATFGAELATGSDRVLSMADTRGTVWSDLFSQFLSSPLVGVQRDLGSESSYLSVAAGFGLIGLFPLAGMVVSMFLQTRAALKHRSKLGKYRVNVDVLAGAFAQVLVVWLFEGFLVGVITDHLVVLGCLFGYMTAISHQVRQVRSISEGSRSPVENEHTDGMFRGDTVAA